MEKWWPEVEYQDNLVAGIPPGGVRDPSIVKIMICYLLQRLGRPVPESELVELLTGEEIIAVPGSYRNIKITTQEDLR